MQSFHVLQRERKPANNTFHPKSSYQGNAWQSHSGNIIGGSHALGLRNKQPSELRAVLRQIPDTPTGSCPWASTSAPRPTCMLAPLSLYFRSQTHLHAHAHEPLCPRASNKAQIQGQCITGGRDPLPLMQHWVHSGEYSTLGTILY